MYYLIDDIDPTLPVCDIYPRTLGGRRVEMLYLGRGAFGDPREDISKSNGLHEVYNTENVLILESS
jgi:hypothetical protein